MKDDFLRLFMGDKNRAQLLRVFVFNPGEVLDATQMSKRAGISTSAAAKEARSLEKMGIVKRGRPTIKLANGTKRVVRSRQKVEGWTLNNDFKHLGAISVFVHEVSPVRYDNIVTALRRSCKISAVILSGAFMGDASRPADLIVAADPLNEKRLKSAIQALEPSFGREIRFAAFSTPEFRYRLTVQDRLLRDTLDFPHLVLLDRTRLL